MKKTTAALIVLLIMFVAVNVFAITVTITRTYRNSGTNESIREGTLSFNDASASYTTGGIKVTPSQFNMQAIRWMEIRNSLDASNTLDTLRSYEYVDASGTIRVYDASTGREASNGESLSNVLGVKFKVFGY